MSAKDLYLTDEQYLERLQLVRQAVLQHKQYWVYDNDSIGNKFTTSNVGLCNDELATREMAMFPELYDQGRRSPKYNRPPHLCPFDLRFEELKDDFSDTRRSGCFYTCGLRKHRYSQEEALHLVDQAIARARVLVES